MKGMICCSCLACLMEAKYRKPTSELVRNKLSLITFVYNSKDLICDKHTAECM